MKNITKNLMLLGAILTFLSCSKGPGENAQCGIMPVDKVLNIKIGSMDKTFDLWKNDGRNNDNDYCIINIKDTISSSEIVTSLHSLNLNGLPEIDPSSLISVVYFINKNLSTQSNYNLDGDDILGLFVYYESGAKMYVKVFEKDNTAYKEIVNLASEIDWINTNNLETYSQIFFENGLSSVSGMIVADTSKIFERKSKDGFSYKLNKYVNQGKSTKPTLDEIIIHDHQYQDTLRKLRA